MTDSRKLSQLKSPFHFLNFPNVSFRDYFLNITSGWGNRTALIDAYTGNKTTYNELNRKSQSVATSLIKRGYEKGDVITIFMKNHPEFVTTVGGVGSANLILSTCNPAYTSSELHFQLTNNTSRSLVTTSDMIPVIADVAKEGIHFKDIFVVGNPPETTFDLPITSFESLCNETAFLEPKSKIDPKNDVLLLPYSSGTTGLPKGVMLTHHNLISNTMAFTSPIDDKGHILINANEDAVGMGLLPMYHIYGLYMFAFCFPTTGLTNVVLKEFEPQIFLETIQNYKVSTLNIVPPLALFLAKSPMVEDYDISSLQDALCAAAPVGPETIDMVVERVKNKNFRLRQAYGLTETSPLASVLPYHLVESTPVASIGYLISNSEAQIADIDTLEPLPIGEEGELLLKGDHIMKGYWKNEHATQNTIYNGWLRTGDIAKMKEKGDIYITDRLKELIKTKGLQVAPAELEALLLTHPAVQDSCVVGLPDERAGELPFAAVVLKAQQRVTEKEIKDFVAAKVAPHKQLQGGVKFFESIPKTASGKILRRVLKASLIK